MKLREKIIMKLREYGDKQRATRIEKERELIDITLILIEEWREKHDNTKRDER